MAMLRVCTVLSSASVRFPHWKSHIRSQGKLRYNPDLNLKPPVQSAKTHDFIDFRTLTGNEVLFNLQNAKHFRPYEYSNAFLVLGTKKGAPVGYEWEKNEFVQTALAEGKRKIPQFTCKVLTSLAHAWGRLGIKDAELWALLETHIVRQFVAIEPRGLARSMVAFSKVQGCERFWTKTLDMLPVYLQKFDHSDAVRAIESLANKPDVPAELYTNWLYPQIKYHRYKCSPSQLERMQQAFEKRSDFTQEWRNMLTEGLEQRYECLRKIKFGGLIVPHDPPPLPGNKVRDSEAKSAQEEPQKAAPESS